MKNIEVSSRIIQSVYFSQKDGKLRICFKNGDERHFTGVPEKEAIAMCEAPSPGQHYIDNIRTRFRRLAA